jgi:hypothetical protein
MGNTRNTGYLQNAIKVSDAGAISFMSGSTMLATINTSGQMSGSSPVLFASTASFVANAQTASFVALAVSASNAVSAQTASFANAFTVAGTLTAQTLVVQTITSSVDFVTGSTRFGSLLDNTHVFSGSVTMNPNGLFVSSSGLVGIGNIVPAYNLDVTGTGRFTGALTTSNISTGLTNGTILIRDNGTAQVEVNIRHTSTRNGVLSFTENGVADRWAIGTKPSDGILYFSANFDLSTPRFTLSSAGAAIFSSSVTAASLTVGSLGSGSDAVISLATNASGSPRTIYYKASTAAINFTSTAGADLMSLTNGGSLGIGTNSPASRFHISGSEANTQTINLQSSANNANAYIVHTSGNKSYVTGLSGDISNSYIIYDNTASTTRLAIASGGSVGIGTITPSGAYMLTLNGNTTSTLGGINLRQNGTDTFYIGNPSVADTTNIELWNPRNGYVRIGTNNAERMRVFSNGIINTGGVTHQYFAGNVAGNASLTFTINCESMSSFRITCVMNHFGYISSYGCANMSLLANGPVITVVTISDTQSGNGGSWSYARVNDSQFTITKNAGSYAGGGNYFVEVVGHNSY